MDLTTLNDEDLNTLRINVLNEQERRADLASIPQTITDLAAKYVAGGGSLGDLSLGG